MKNTVLIYASFFLAISQQSSAEQVGQQGQVEKTKVTQTTRIYSCNILEGSLIGVDGRVVLDRSNQESRSFQIAIKTESFDGKRKYIGYQISSQGQEIETSLLKEAERSWQPELNRVQDLNQKAMTRYSEEMQAWQVDQNKHSQKIQGLSPDEAKQIPYQGLARPQMPVKIAEPPKPTMSTDYSYTTSERGETKQNAQLMIDFNRQKIASMKCRETLHDRSQNAKRAGDVKAYGGGVQANATKTKYNFNQNYKFSYCDSDEVSGTVSVRGQQVRATCSMTGESSVNQDSSSDNSNNNEVQSLRQKPLGNLLPTYQQSVSRGRETFRGNIQAEVLNPPTQSDSNFESDDN